MKKIPVLCVRTRMCGGGTSYDVLVPKRFKKYYPIAFGIYATVIQRNGDEFFRISDALRTPEIDNLPALTDERLNAFRHLERVEKRLAIRIAKRAFPELRAVTSRGVSIRQLPTLWATWTLPSEQRLVPTAINLN